MTRSLTKREYGQGLRLSNRFTVEPVSPAAFESEHAPSAAHQGCVSALFSNRACTTTIAASAPPAFSAIAVDGQGRWGFGVGMRSEAEARSGALGGCGTSARRIEKVAQAPCIAFAESRSGGYWFGLSVDQSQQKVKSVAMERCAKGAPAGTRKPVNTGCR